MWTESTLTKLLTVKQTAHTDSALQETEHTVEDDTITNCTRAELLTVHGWRRKKHQILKLLSINIMYYYCNQSAIAKHSITEVKTSSVKENLWEMCSCCWYKSGTGHTCQGVMMSNSLHLKVHTSEFTFRTFNLLCSIFQKTCILKVLRESVDFLSVISFLWPFV
jgi:hypothetical protein